LTPARLSVLERLLGHPATRGLDLDDPATTAIRREVVRSKPFLKAVYDEWYGLMLARLPDVEGSLLELGAGGGFLKERQGDVITSEVFPVPGIDRVVDAQRLPFEDSSLRAILMTNVFHHIPDVALFLTEAERTLVPGGRIIMVEPWNTWWSRFVHRHLHVEPMMPDVAAWEFPASGPVSSANAALPWIVTARDRDKLESEWRLRVIETRPFMPFRYLASGGVSLRSLQPRWTFNAWKAAEGGWVGSRMAVFALIVVGRIQ
jgi:SAM-dependent methyltransferase